MIQIRDFNTPQEAYIAQGMLENNGIQAHVELNTLYSLYPSAGGQGAASLYVSEADAKKAIALLDSHDD